MPSLQQVCELSSFIDIAQQTVCGTSAYSRQLSHIVADHIKLRSGVPQVLRTIVHKTHLCSADSVTAQFQTSSSVNISTKTVG